MANKLQRPQPCSELEHGMFRCGLVTSFSYSMLELVSQCCNCLTFQNTLTLTLYVCLLCVWNYQSWIAEFVLELITTYRYSYSLVVSRDTHSHVLIIEKWRECFDSEKSEVILHASAWKRLHGQKRASEKRYFTIWTEVFLYSNIISCNSGQSHCKLNTEL